MPKHKNIQPQKRPRSTLRIWIIPAALAAVFLLTPLLLQRNVKGSPASEIAAAPDQGQIAAATAAPALPTIVAVQPTLAAPTVPPTSPTEPVTAAPGAMTSADEVQRIAPAEAKALLDKGEAVMYDVRSAESYQAKHVAGAISLPEEQIPSQLSTLPKDKILILYCT